MAKCRELVSDGGGGYHFHVCGKTAKWLVRDEPVCGLHARLDNYFVKTHGRKPIEPQVSEKRT